MSKTILLNHSNWHFTKENTGIPTAIMGEAITLPHTWNAVDGQDGGNDYYRGTCWYTLALTMPAIPAGGKAVLQLDGAATTSKRKICWQFPWTTATTAPCTPRKRTLLSTAAFTGM